MFACGLVFLGLLLAAVFWVVGKFNGLVTLKNQAANAWKQIDVQLKRRHDLIPNLVSAVKGEMKFEQDTLEKVVQARNLAVSASANPAQGIAAQAQSEGVLTQALSRLIAVVENYPALKANEQVKALMEELTSTENKIGFARQFYNDIATRFNTAQQVFPEASSRRASTSRPSSSSRSPTPPSAKCRRWI